MELLSKYVEFKNGKKRPDSKGSIPVYGGNGILDYTNVSNMNKGVVIGRVGVYCGSVFLVKDECWVSDNAIKAMCYENMDLSYLYYLLSSLQLNERRIGTSQPLLTQNILNNIEVDVPALDKQKKIASILESLDKKIQLNNEINNNLEQQAQALFKAWFVDFETNSGTMPSNWKTASLSSIARISTEVFSPSKNPNVEVEHYSIPALDENRYPVFEKSDGIKSNKYRLTHNSVMISKLNPDTKRIWRPYCISNTPVCSTEFIVYEPVKTSYRDFVYSIIDSEKFSNFLCAHTTGSTNSRQRVTPSITLNYDIVLPDDETICMFSSIVSPMYDTIENNIKVNQLLAETRDKLLPKLMSGELDVSNIDL